MLPAIGIAALHEAPDILAAIHFIEGVEDQGAARRHVKKVGIDTAAFLSGEIWVDGGESGVPHHGLDHHFAEDPLQGGAFILVIAVAKQPIPHIKPDEMYHFVNARSNSASLTVQIKDVEAVLPQEAGLDGIHADMTAQIVEQRPAIDAEGV